MAKNNRIVILQSLVGQSQLPFHSKSVSMQKKGVETYDHFIMWTSECNYWMSRTKYVIYCIMHIHPTNVCWLHAVIISIHWVLYYGSMN